MTLLSRSTLEADLIRHQQNGDFAAQAETLMAMAEIAYEEQEYNIAQGLYAQAWAAYEKVGNQKGLADTMLALGYTLNHIFWDYTNLSPISPEFSRAEINLFYELALDFYIALDDKRGQAETYTAMGHEAFDGEERAQTNYKLALECYEALEDIRGQASTLQRMGENYGYSHPKSQPMFESAVKLYQELGDQRNEAVCTMYLGLIAETKCDYKTAQHQLKYAHAIFISIGATEWIDLNHKHLEIIRNKTEPDRIYQIQCKSTSTFLYHKGIPDKMVTLWEDFLKTEDKCAERLSMQSLLSYSVKIGNPELQARLYWHWGRMEYYRHFRREMGLALCQWAVSLMQTEAFDIDLVMSLYQEPLDQMRRAIL